MAERAISGKNRPLQSRPRPQAWQPPRAAELLRELWQTFPDGENVIALFAEHASVEFPVPLVRGLPRRFRGRSNIAQARETLLALDPSFRFQGELRAMASVSNQVVAEYRRPASEAHRASSRRLFVCLIEENGLVASLRVVLERRFWTVRK